MVTPASNRYPSEGHKDKRILPPFTPHPRGKLIPVEQALHLDASEVAWSGSLEGTAPLDSWPWAGLAERAQSLYRRGWISEPIEVTSYTAERRDDDTVRLDLRVPVVRNKRETLALEELDLTSRPCHFGGVRWFFACGFCGQLRARVYRLWTWGCQRCMCLTYESRQKYNRASRHGFGRRRLWFSLDRQEIEAARRRRRNWRRRVSRWRTAPTPTSST